MGVPEVNIGLVGHIDHGKTTLTERLSGIWTDRHSEELKRGITIRLGYADCTFFKKKGGKGTEAYSADPALAKDSNYEEVRTISFVDAPGHETLMATMLAGASIMDGAMLVIAANEQCPQPQTKEHLMALDIIGIDKIIIVQNKIDLVSPEQAKANYDQIKEFVKGTVAENAPIIPVSAEQNVNLDALIETIEEIIPTPPKDDAADPFMYVARSFDINKPGSDPRKIKGGVLGGAMTKGRLADGQEVEIRPGVDGKSIVTKIVTINQAGDKVKDVGKGGTFGVGTLLDPSLTKSDKMAGRVVGLPGKLPPVHNELNLEVHLLDRVVGSTDELNVQPLQPKEPLMLNVGTGTTLGIVSSSNKKGVYNLLLKLPVCADKGTRVTMARRVGTRWRLIGYGIIQ